MRRLLILATMLFGLTLGSCKDGRDEWNTICPWLEGIALTCENVERPIVEYFDSDNVEFGLQGWYDGGDTIYIRGSLSKKQTSSVIVHEIVHYLQFQNGFLILPGPAKQICEAEDQAFRITDIYREYIGQSPVADGWWRNYWYCWQYYAPSGSKMIVLELPTGEILIDIIE